MAAAPAAFARENVYTYIREHLDEIRGHSDSLDEKEGVRRHADSLDETSAVPPVPPAPPAPPPPGLDGGARWRWLDPLGVFHVKGDAPGGAKGDAQHGPVGPVGATSPAADAADAADESDAAAAPAATAPTARARDGDEPDAQPVGDLLAKMRLSLKTMELNAGTRLKEWQANVSQELERIRAHQLELIGLGLLDRPDVDSFSAGLAFLDAPKETALEAAQRMVKWLRHEADVLRLGFSDGDDSDGAARKPRSVTGDSDDASLRVALTAAAAAAPVAAASAAAAPVEARPSLQERLESVYSSIEGYPALDAFIHGDQSDALPLWALGVGGNAPATPVAPTPMETMTMPTTMTQQTATPQLPQQPTPQQQMTAQQPTPHQPTLVFMDGKPNSLGLRPRRRPAALNGSRPLLLSKPLSTLARNVLSHAPPRLLQRIYAHVGSAVGLAGACTVCRSWRERCGLNRRGGALWQ
ncbi:hypothetical protein M885DRAFT_154907 [Pelagophyceae sp. CCMP2097]|nr:hypothetical protein M885DRAFT_154907 [Pelagophyceae sp. CCMP2097]